uniref:ribosomal protein L16 n=1 Tax=Caulacanthus ustulatus TaxID=31411 RepID=UPI00300106EE|nr:ribosomal protein L16 [Caulacanthus ustulatus]
MKTHNKYNLKFRHSNHLLKFGRLGIKSNTFSISKENQIAFLERYLLQSTAKIKAKKNAVKIWNRVYFNLVLTKLSSESRMGKGKGSIHGKALFLKPGDLLFEFDGITIQQANLLCSLINKKSSLTFSLVTK